MSGACQVGFADVRCGGAGSACVDCTALVPASTCDVNGSPPRCKSEEQPACPAAYPGCPAGLAMVPFPAQNACSASDLLSAAGACAGGAHTYECNYFFSMAVDSTCAACLGAFDYDFVEQVGIALCLTPYLSATCSHTSACIVDCVQFSCQSCPDSGSAESCDLQVQSSACASYVQDPCIAQALSLAGAVCNPSTYQDQFGAWLMAVGAKACGP
jgi:hypothetical protein